MADICDVSYVLLLEQVDRSWQVQAQIAATAIGMGARDVQVPDPLAAREALDAALNEEPPATGSGRPPGFRLDALGVDGGR